MDILLHDDLEDQTAMKEWKVYKNSLAGQASSE